MLARLEPLGKCNLLLHLIHLHLFDDHGQVCLQETGEEADQEEERGDDGDHGEADLAEDQLQIRCQPRLRLRDEGRPLPRCVFNFANGWLLKY